MVILQIKPLSVNGAYKGRRFATKELTSYKSTIGYMLPKREIPEGKLAVRYEFGVSSSGADLDNCVKAFQDSLSEKYGFNDNRIFRAEIEKKVVKKGEEYIAFEITKA